MLFRHLAAWRFFKRGYSASTSATHEEEEDEDEDEEEEDEAEEEEEEEEEEDTVSYGGALAKWTVIGLPAVAD